MEAFHLMCITNLNVSFVQLTMKGIKQYACGYPFISDNPFRLKRDYGMLIHKLDSQLYYCYPPEISPPDFNKLSTQNLNQHIFKFIAQTLNLERHTAIL